MQSTDNNTWLCRNCNTLVDIKLGTCPSCNALRPEDEVNNEAIPEGISQEVRIENYTNASITTWPLLRSVADIAHRTREIHERK